MPRLSRIVTVALVPLLAVGAVLLAQPPAKPRKVALLVGVGDYKHNLPPLGKTPANDVTELAKVLRAGGYEAVVMTDADATKAAVEAAFERALNGQRKVGDAVSRLGQGDALVVHLCGHGVQTKRAGADAADGEQPFFCPHDAVPNKPDTQVRLNALIGDAADLGVRAMFLVDACRDNPDPRLRGRTGIQGTKAVMPDGVTVLFSCGRGQTAQQDDKLGHGLFTYAVLRTLRGETGLAGKTVSWAALVSDVEEQFSDSGPVKTALGSHLQSPVEAKGEAGRTLLLAVAPLIKKSGDEPGRKEQKPWPANAIDPNRIELKPPPTNGYESRQKPAPANADELGRMELEPPSAKTADATTHDAPPVATSNYDLSGGRRSAHFGPGGSVRALVTVNDDTAKRYEVHVIDPVAGRTVAGPLTHAKKVNHAAFSPDGRRIVTASDDKTAAVWDAATGKMLDGPLQHAEGPEFAAFSPDGRRVVTAGFNIAAVWDAATGEKLAEPQHHRLLNYAAFSPDGRRVVTAGVYTADMWDAATGKSLAEPLTHASRVNRAVFSPDGTRVVTAGSDKTAAVWDAATGKRVAGPLTHADIVVHAAFSPDGPRIVTASTDNTALVWNAATGVKLAGPLTHADGVWHAAFSPDGTRVVTASSDNTAAVWDAATGKRIAGPLTHASWVRSAVFSPDGKRVVTAEINTSTLWDAVTGEKIGSITVK